MVQTAKKAFIRLSLCLILILQGCATVHKGSSVTPGLTSDSSGATAFQDTGLIDGLRITKAILPNLSTTHLLVIEYTFENTTADWASLSSMQIDFGNPVNNKRLTLPNGRQLILWSEAIQNRNAIIAYNEQLILSAIALIAAGAMNTTSHPTVKIGSTITALGGVAGLTITQLNASRSHAEGDLTSPDPHKNIFENLFPPTHLLHGDLLIPPGLFLRRWMLVYYPTFADLQNLKEITLKYVNTFNQPRTLHHTYDCPVPSSSI